MTAAPLLAAILARPGDDLPRLVYADALEEAGQSDKAAFIRDQIRTGDASWGCIGTPADGLPCPWCVAGFKFFFRRGLVAEVCTSLARWCGGVCLRCEGRGTVLGPTPQTSSTGPVPCGSKWVEGCPGTGRIVGRGPSLCREHPVEKVMLTCRQPFVYPATERRDEYQWHQVNRAADQTPDRDASVLPDRLFDLLVNVAPKPTGRTTFMGIAAYRTRDAAMQSLSAACLAWARSRPAT